MISNSDSRLFKHWQRPATYGVFVLGWLLLSLAACDSSGEEEAASSDNAGPTTQVEVSDPEVPAAEDAAEFCAVLDDQLGQITDRFDDATDADPIGAILEMFATYGELELAMSRLAAAAPDEISDDMAIVAESMQTDAAGAIDNPLAAVLQALVTSATTQGSVDRVDAFADRECGRPVFGQVVFRATEETTPRKVDNKVLLDVTNVYGEELCAYDPTAAVEFEAFVNDQVAAIVCQQPLHVGLGRYRTGERAFGLHLDRLDVIWQVDLNEYAEDPTKGVTGGTWHADGGTLAVAFREELEPEGLELARTRSIVKAWDVATGEKLFTEVGEELTVDDEDAGKQHLRVGFVDGEGRVAILASTEDEATRAIDSNHVQLRILDRDGTRWRTLDPHPRGPSLAPVGDLYVAAALNDAADDIRTQLRRYSDDQLLHSENVSLSSNDFRHTALNQREYEWEAHSPYVQTGRADTSGPAVLVLNTDTAEEFRVPYPVDIYTHAGVLTPTTRAGRDRDFAFFNEDGEVFAIRGETTSGSMTYRNGRLFVENTAGDWVAVDLDTGDQEIVGTLPPDDRTDWVGVIDGRTHITFYPPTG